jgi:3-oxoacyl-[acyl-carrier protein] reductase
VGTALFLATDDSSHLTGVYRNADGDFDLIDA